jgi:Flp pilus assembly protein TadG
MSIDRKKLVGTLNAGLEDRRGATAVVFAVSLAVLAPMAMGAVDIYATSLQRAKLQDALDAAALYAAKSTATTDTDLDAAGERSLKANLKLVAGATLLAADFHANGTKVIASASVKVPAFAPTLFPHQPVEVGSQVERAMDDLEVALVLDNTGSMSGTKIATLITESKKLVGKLEAAGKRTDHPATAVKIALVPFSFAVRPVGSVDLTNYDTSTHTGTGVPAWIDPQGKAHRLKSASAYDTLVSASSPANLIDRLAMMKLLTGKTWAGCVESRTYPYDVTDDAPTAGDAASWFVPYFWPDEPDGGNYANDYVTDKAGTGWLALQQDDSKYSQNYKSHRYGKTFSAAVQTYTYGPNAGCTLQPVIRLTSDMKSITDAIDGMKAIGTTNIGEGLVWGWHALSPNQPLADGKAYNTEHLRKVIILMTDGENTFFDAKDANNKNNSDYTGLGYIWQNMLGITSGTDADRTKAMDDRMKELCTNAKKKKIEIYTILVEESSTASSALLTACASSSAKFYNVQNVATLGVAFDAIAGSITNMRISH